MKAHYPRAQRNDWETPAYIFGPLNDEFHFTLDAAASETNTKCPFWYSAEDDALTRDWRGVVWCNPPYGHKTTRAFVKKGWEESRKGATVVMLVPANTSSHWWHDYAMKGEIRFLRGRVRFVGAVNYAMFSSAIVIFRPSATNGEGTE